MTGVDLYPVDLVSHRVIDPPWEVLHRSARPSGRQRLALLFVGGAEKLSDREHPSGDMRCLERLSEESTRVDRQDRARDEAGLVGQEPQNCVGHIVLLHPPSRHRVD